MATITTIKTQERSAYSLAEVAEKMGKHRSWAYRQARAGNIKTITGYGNTLVSAAEVQRILNGEPPTRP